MLINRILFNFYFFSEWSMGFQKWSSIPEIKIEFVSLNIDENEEEEEENGSNKECMIDFNDVSVPIPIESN